MPAHGVEHAQQLAEAAPLRDGQVAPPRVDVLAEQRQLAHALAGEALGLGEQERRRGGYCSRPRTDGTMQYEHVELQPCEICSQAWNGRSRCIGRSPGELVERREVPARHVAAGAG